MRLVEYSDDVAEYLDSGMMVLALNRSLFRLMLTDDGKPTEGEYTDHGGGLYWWVVAGHSLIVRQTEDTTSIANVYAGELRETEEIERRLSQYR